MKIGSLVPALQEFPIKQTPKKMLTPITRSSEGQLLDNPARADPGEGQERAPGENPLGVSGRENIPGEGTGSRKA